jgi:SNF2 family DNA or RNA helicase
MNVPILTRAVNGRARIEIPKLPETVELGMLRNVNSTTKDGAPWWSFPATGYGLRHAHALLREPTWDVRDSSSPMLVELWRDGQDRLVHREHDSKHIPVMPMWPHQQEAFDFAMKRHGVLLYMGMGTGKTKVTIDVCETRKCDRILIICPLAVVDVWDTEFGKHGKHIECVPLGKGSVDNRASSMRKAHGLATALGKSIAFVINFETLLSDNMMKAIDNIPFDTIVVDECHRIKAAGGKQSRALGQRATAFRFRIGLTGTPLGKDALDAFGQYRLLDSAIFGLSFARFRSQYAIVRDGPIPIIDGFKNIKDFQKKFYAIAHRVDRDVLNLKAPITINRTCVLGVKARAIYSALDAELIAELKEGSITANNVLTKMLRLHQIGCGFARLDNAPDGELLHVDSAKANLLKDVVKDIDSAEPFVVFCHFTEDSRMIAAALKDAGISFSRKTGGHDELKDWQEGNTQALIANIQAGSVGVDFTRAAICIYYSLNFRLLDYEQSLARVHRPGQLRTVTYVNLTVADTIDVKVFKAHAEKRDIIKEALTKPGA